MQVPQERVRLSPTMGEVRDQKITRGPTGERVAQNLRNLRDARQISRQKLSERMESLERKIVPSGIEKIERQTRRVDVDDLVALALALDTTPNALLMPHAADETEAYLTPNVHGSAAKLWRWATGERALPDIWGSDDRRVFDLDREERFRRENRPHEPLSQFTLADMERHRDVLQPLERAVHTALEAGIPLDAILAHVELVQTSRSILQGIQQKAEGGDDGQG